MKKKLEMMTKLNFFFFRIHKKRSRFINSSWKELRPKNCELNIYGPDGDGTKLKLQNEVIKII